MSDDLHRNTSKRYQEAAKLYDQYLAHPDARIEAELAVERARQDPQIQALLKAHEDSERMTAEDLAITITPCPIE